MYFKHILKNFELVSCLKNLSRFKHLLNPVSKLLSVIVCILTIYLSASVIFFLTTAAGRPSIVAVIVPLIQFIYPPLISTLVPPATGP